MKIRKFTRYPFSIIIILVIWTVCLIPIPETPLDDVGFIDKWTHFVMYGTMTAVIWQEYAICHNTISWRRLLVFGVLAPIMMGGAVELAQAYLTTCRSGDWLDAACNALGTLIGAATGCGAIYYRQHR